MGKWKLKFWGSKDELEPDAEELRLQPSTAAALSPARLQIDAALSMLRDVEGVVGSLAIAPTGRLLGSDLPRLFDPGATETLAIRLNQVRATLASAGGSLQTAAFRYETHSLHVTQLASGVIGVLAESATHEPALDMATRLVGQRIDAATGAIEAGVGAAAVSVIEAGASAAPASVSEAPVSDSIGAVG